MACHLDSARPDRAVQVWPEVWLWMFRLGKRARQPTSIGRDTCDDHHFYTFNLDYRTFVNIYKHSSSLFLQHWVIGQFSAVYILIAFVTLLRKLKACVASHHWRFFGTPPAECPS